MIYGSMTGADTAEASQWILAANGKDISVFYLLALDDNNVLIGSPPIARRYDFSGGPSVNIPINVYDTSLRVLGLFQSVEEAIDAAFSTTYSTIVAELPRHAEYGTSIHEYSLNKQSETRSFWLGLALLVVLVLFLSFMY